MHAMHAKLSICLLLLLSPATLAAQDEIRVSAFGEYAGYSEERFDEWVSTSEYVEMRDGVLLAVTVTRPAVGGEAVAETFPLVWTHSRYHRTYAALTGNPTIRSMVDSDPTLQRLVRHGYVVASAAVRGSGASFGVFEGLFSEAETADAIELIEWFTEQPYCDGNIGMYGGSYLGITQYMAASKSPPALKAIVPEVAAFDMFDLAYPGGVSRTDLWQHWGSLTRRLDHAVRPTPVDGDEDGAMLDVAIAEHEGNWPVEEGYASSRFRDEVTGFMDWSTHGPSNYLDEVNDSGVAIYHFNGWFDVFALDTTLWFANYTGPQKMMMGGWSHAGMPEPAVNAERQRLRGIEQHRWFDRWLRGIENGVEDGPRAHYALMVEPGSWEWWACDEWPAPEASPRRLFLANGPSGSVASVNDGVLATAEPEASVDVYAVDPTTTTGTSTRWDNAVGAAPAMVYAGLAKNDTKCLTYTTPVLEEDLIVVGHPVVTLFVTSDTGDADLYVLLEEVDAEGAVRYVSEAVLRASQRALGEAPYDNLGLPWQPILADGAQPLSATEPAEVQLDLHPTATLFDAGHRLRVSIMGADADNTELAPRAAETTLGVHLGVGGPSSIVLPIIE